MLEVKDGKIFVEGIETTDVELIGLAFKDFAEKTQGKKCFLIRFLINLLFRMAINY